MKSVLALVALAAILSAAAPPPVPNWRDARPAIGAHAMVATEQHLASQVGVDVLKAGGNAVDAAVAVAYALAVVDPCCGNIGGGGFMLVRMNDGRERFIDFREKAPARATRNMFLDRNGNVVPGRSTKGWLAVGVPGTVLGLETARKEFGSKSREELMAPAIALARDGFVLSDGDLIPFRGSLPQDYSRFAEGKMPVVGEVFRQRHLAATLSSISRAGADAFYRGPIARAVVAASDLHGGILSLDDFKNYSVEESTPLHCSFHGYDIASIPPPSSGGIAICEILNIVSPYPLARWDWHSAKSAHYIVEAERRVFADRNADLGDPDFVKDPVKQLLSPAYAATLRAQIQPEKATPSTQVKPRLSIRVHENDDTTHFSIVDAQGNAVALTFTINDWFGAGVVAGETGFFLNDEMDDFTSKPGAPNMYGLVQGVQDDIVAGKRPLSSMTPTIVTRDGKLAMVTGSPGGARIITITLETLLDALEYGMNAQQAVDAPRMHMQWLPDRIDYESGAFDDATMATLRADGYTFDEIDSWGSAQVIVVDPRTGTRYGASDPRRPTGAALGY